MSSRTTFLGSLIGLYCIPVAIAMLIRKQATVDVLTHQGLAPSVPIAGAGIEHLSRFPSPATRFLFLPRRHPSSRHLSDLRGEQARGALSEVGYFSPPLLQTAQES